MPDKKLVNGSRGIVTGFVTAIIEKVQYGAEAGKYVCAVVRFDSGTVITVIPATVMQGGPGGYCVRQQLPLKLAWALTIHKSQGSTLTRAELRLDESWAVSHLLARASKREPLPS
jgi:ATP-dependent exoDNAse (exonuclease V) alpha subunit